MKKKQDPLMLVIYGVIVLFILYFAAVIGTALELSIDDNGGLDITRLSTSIESVMTDTGTVMSRLADTSSMTFVFVIFSAFAIGLYALMK